MAILEGPFVFLMMVMPVDCPSVPVPENEEEMIIDAALKARSIEFSDTEFESISVTKCISYPDQGKSQATQDRTESVNFYGEFPQDIQTDLYSERRYVRCHASIDYRDNAAVKQRDGCTEVVSRYMQHQGLAHEVVLREAVSVEDATAYLDYLLNYDFGNVNNRRTDPAGNNCYFERSARKLSPRNRTWTRVRSAGSVCHVYYPTL